MKAFPHKGGGVFTDINGMDLRDYFAAAALKGIFSGPEFEIGAYDNYPDWQKGMAELAYGFADAMMEARKQ